MSQRLNNLNDIVALLDAGAKYYREGAAKLSDPELVSIFKENAALRETAAGELRQVVDANGGEPAKASLIETAYGLYGKLMTSLGDTRERLVASLEEHEDRTLDAYRKAIGHEDNAEDQSLLEAQFEGFKAAHDKMRALKQAA
ncbi:MAG: PA2169 family four-helix-bundle protein [Paracoccaceae bacterium]